MRLGKKKIFLLKIIFVFLFMFFICTLTINYLYRTSNITKEEYLKLLLNDTYGDNFYKELVEIINNNFNPIKMIELKEVSNKHFKLSNKEVKNPIVYVYSDNYSYSYKKEYNITPNMYLVSYLLSEELNKLKINSIFENSNIDVFIKNNNMTKEEGINFFLNDKLNNYHSIKYTINVERSMDSKRNTTVKINNKKYALIGLYANKNNLDLITKLNNKLNEKYKGISKIYIDSLYDSSINIDFGGQENSMYEVLNSIKVFSKIFYEVI